MRVDVIEGGWTEGTFALVREICRKWDSKGYFLVVLICNTDSDGDGHRHKRGGIVVGGYPFWTRCLNTAFKLQ